MLKALLRRQIDRMERQFDYDASYMRRVLAASPASFLKFGFVTRLVDRKAAPAEALAAAGIAGTLAEDCGPCTQISVDMAAANGVGPRILRAILAGDEAGMGEAGGPRLALRPGESRPRHDGRRPASGGDRPALG
jgi:hypothetical protein